MFEGPFDFHWILIQPRQPCALGRGKRSRRASDIHGLTFFRFLVNHNYAKPPFWSFCDHRFELLLSRGLWDTLWNNRSIEFVFVGSEMLLMILSFLTYNILAASRLRMFLLSSLGVCLQRASRDRPRNCRIWGLCVCAGRCEAWHLDHPALGWVKGQTVPITSLASLEIYIPLAVVFQRITAAVSEWNFARFKYLCVQHFLEPLLLLAVHLVDLLQLIVLEFLVFF